MAPALARAAWWEVQLQAGQTITQSATSIRTLLIAPFLGVCWAIPVVLISVYLLLLAAGVFCMCSSDSPPNKTPDKIAKIAMMARDQGSPPAQIPSVLGPTRAPQLAPHSGPSATVPLPQGRYTGVLLSASPELPRAVEAWRGIPYAQSTGGEKRFRPPVPLAPAKGHHHLEVRAERLGQICPTVMAAAAVGSESGIAAGEDCLNLNVYRQQQQQQQSTEGKLLLLPVVVYVHGGAFNTGMGAERDMASFVSHAETPILGVNFNYRVGALGFPSCGVADREGCLNLGLRDQQMLFGWVRENIEAFGGDPGRVTLMGLSAGAHSIGYHLQSYASSSSSSAAPFHAAILESGGATARATLSPTHPRTEAQWREFLLELDVKPTSVGRPGDLFALLRSLPLDAVVRASGAVFGRYLDPVRWPFQPVVATSWSDAVVATELPITRFRRGEFLKIPILTGFNTNEGTVFCNPRTDTASDFLAKFRTMVPALLGGDDDDDLASLAKIYPDPARHPTTSPYARVPPGFGAQWARYEAAYAHYAYICPTLQTGHFYSETYWEEEGKKMDGEEEERPPVWVYHFAARSRAEFGGTANHGDEAVVVAHDMKALAPHPGLVRTADAMHGAWVRFIAAGDPNVLPVSSASSCTSEYYWPRFESPFLGDTAAAPGALVRKKGAGGRRGLVMMFGEGNDERMGGEGRRSPGTPARVVGLTEREVAACQYWWERVELSEGMGRWLGGAMKARL